MAPDSSRPLYERAAIPVISSRAGSWFYVYVAPHFDRTLLRLTGGASALWQLVNRRYPGYEVYQRRAGVREIPIMVLEPRSPQANAQFGEPSSS